MHHRFSTWADVAQFLKDYNAGRKELLAKIVAWPSCSRIRSCGDWTVFCPKAA